MINAILRPFVVAWYYLLMTNFPFKSVAVALALAFWGGYELRGML